MKSYRVVSVFLSVLLIMPCLVLASTTPSFAATQGIIFTKVTWSKGRVDATIGAGCTKLKVNISADIRISDKKNVVKVTLKRKKPTKTKTVTLDLLSGNYLKGNWGKKICFGTSDKGTWQVVKLSAVDTSGHRNLLKRPSGMGGVVKVKAVGKPVKIKLSTTKSAFFKDPIQARATLTKGGKALSNRTIVFKFGSKVIKRKTNSKGIATVKYTMESAKNTSVSAEYLGKAKKEQRSQKIRKTIAIDKFKTILKLVTPTKTGPGTSLEPMATLTSQGAPLTRATLKYTLTYASDLEDSDPCDEEGDDYDEEECDAPNTKASNSEDEKTAVTDAQGTAKANFKTRAQDDDTATLTVRYEGDKFHSSSVVSKVIVIAKSPTLFSLETPASSTAGEDIQIRAKLASEGTELGNKAVVITVTPSPAGSTLSPPQACNFDEEGEPDEDGGYTADGEECPEEEGNTSLKSKEYSLLTDANGVVTVPSFITPRQVGSLIVTAAFKGDANYLATTISNTVTHSKIPLSIQTPVGPASVSGAGKVPFSAFLTHPKLSVGSAKVKFVVDVKVSGDGQEWHLDDTVIMTSTNDSGLASAEIPYTSWSGNSYRIRVEVDSEDPDFTGVSESFTMVHT